MSETTRIDSDKRTTVRVGSEVGRDAKRALVKLGLGALGAVSPPLVSGLAEHLFFAAPPRRRASPRQLALLATARPLAIPLGSLRIATWSWGEGPPVLLVHGWAGRGAQLAALAAPLAAAGHRVIAFDAPGHGDSDGSRSSLLDFADAIHAVAARTGPLAGIAAHSFGATATAFAMSHGLDASRAVFFGPPSDPGAYFRGFLGRVGVPFAMRAGVARDLERRNHFRFSDLDVRAIGAAMHAPLLVIHDEEDAEVPWAEGAAIADAWPGARLASTRGLGHNAILRDPEALSLATDFLAGREISPRSIPTPVSRACATPGCGRAVAVPRPGAACERCALEIELFDRRSRWAANG